MSGTPLVAVDTSVAIPLVVADHAEHRSVLRWWARRDLHLAGHAAAETYSVLTRLPGGLRLTGLDAAELLGRRFASVLEVSSIPAAAVPRHLAGIGVVGGAVYDALVAMAAADNGAVPATRDLRARDTYERVGVTVEIAA